MILRRVARPLLAAAVVLDGVRALRTPHREIEAIPGARERLDDLGGQVPYVPLSAATIVRALGVVKIAAGVALGTGVVPRLAAGVAAGLQASTLVSAHPLWAVPSDERGAHVEGIVRDAAVLGGLLLATADTEGRPSLAWRVDAARTRSTKSASKAVRQAEHKAGTLARRAVSDVERSVEGIVDSARAKTQELLA